MEVGRNDALLLQNFMIESKISGSQRQREALAGIHTLIGTSAKITG